MYFNNKNNTNIDDEFDNDNILSNILKFLSRYKIIIIISIFLIVVLVLMFIVFSNRKVSNYLILNGEEIVTIYQGGDYIEAGYNGYNSKNVDLTSDVTIETNLNKDVIGEYEIVYKLGDIVKTRIVKVIDKPKDYTFIYLTTVNNNVDIYLQRGVEYKEPGYQVFSTTSSDLTSKVKVSGNVDTSKRGTYKLIYSVVDNSGVTISVSRKVIVMDSDVSLTLNPDGYTNKDVVINAYVVDEYFDYMILPNNEKVTVSSYSYKVNENGKYTFKVYNKKGSVKESNIEVKNIDRVGPSGSCKISYENNGAVIKVSASDVSGINRYVYNNKEYSNSNISLSTYVDSAKVLIYDNAGNSKEISCKAEAVPIVKSIDKDGIIIKVNAKKVGADISGYYFSYTNERPNKDSGGYIATSNESIDVVRLVGTTYVWVEDKSGKISKSKKITLSSNLFLDIFNNNVKILKGISLEDYLNKQGTSPDELNKLLARSVRAAGLYTGEAAATAATTLTGVLAQKYKIRLPYESAGLHFKIGVRKSWGKYTFNYNTRVDGYAGMDCSGFVSWTLVNAGYNVSSNPLYWGGFKIYDFSRENGEIGDVLTVGVKQGNRHVKIIIGKTDEGFLVAEASGGYSGVLIRLHKYSNPDGYGIEKYSDLISKYSKSNYPNGF